MEEDTKLDLNSADDEECTEDSAELSDEELSKAAGGGTPHMIVTEPSMSGKPIPPGPPG